MQQSPHHEVPNARVLLSPKEVSLITGISVAQLELWRIKGNGGPRFQKIGRLVKYARSDINAWVRAHGFAAGIEVEAV